jgi:hypothetical protein
MRWSPPKAASVPSRFRWCPAVASVRSRLAGKTVCLIDVTLGITVFIHKSSDSGSKLPSCTMDHNVPVTFDEISVSRPSVDLPFSFALGYTGESGKRLVNVLQLSLLYSPGGCLWLLHLGLCVCVCVCVCARVPFLAIGSGPNCLFCCVSEGGEGVI